MLSAPPNVRCRSLGSIRPVEQCRRTSGPFHRVPVELPNLIDDVIRTGFDDVRPFVGVAGKVDLDDAIRRNSIDIFERIKVVIVITYVGTIHVKQETAAGFLRYRANEIPLGPGGRGELKWNTW